MPFMDAGDEATSGETAMAKRPMTMQGGSTRADMFGNKSLPFVETQAIYCGDNLDKLRDLPDACIDLIYIDPSFNSNRNFEVFWGETKEKRACLAVLL